MTDKELADYVRALTRELDGYQKAGMREQAAEVQAELDRIAAKGETPAKRATRRVADRGTAR